MPIDRIQLAHGSGIGLKRLLQEIVLPALVPSDAVGEDAAIIPVDKGRIAFTTDSFVVQPLEFPGGDIGKLAACGTINDLAMMGARVACLSVSIIIEEGIDTELLGRVLRSLRQVCDTRGVRIACGDTKVVDRGKADGLFITTSGIGVVPPGRNLSAANARPGDRVLVSGPIGRHGIAILAKRKELAFASSVISDCAPLDSLAEAMLAGAPDTHAMRDATRGGCAAVLNEIGEASHVTIKLHAGDLPVPEAVAGACSFLGFDPLQIANEGTFVALVPSGQAEAALSALHAHPQGRGARIIGEVVTQGRFPLVLETAIGGLRPVGIPPGEILPRIC